ncbi:MAG: hypothetical protein HC915_04550 [Anaerolineae bacterium]|nr:hypothetical protein [Anaerolineae bacterium]
MATLASLLLSAFVMVAYDVDAANAAHAANIATATPDHSTWASKTR